MAWENHLLDALDEPELEFLRPALRRMPLKRDTLLAKTGEPVTHILLPVTCILSVVAVMKDGRSVETRTIGRESGFGLLQALGSRRSFEQMTVQVAGEAWRVPVEAMAEAARKFDGVTRCIVHHAQATILQCAQATACNGLHSAEQRLCRWLLLTQDRLGSNVLPLTQEHLSIMLAVQRTTITAIAGELQARGLVSYARGQITVLDRERLMRCSCECYGAIEAAIQDIIGQDAFR